MSMSLLYMVPVLEAVQKDNISITSKSVIEITTSIAASMISLFLFYKMLSFTNSILTKEEQKPLKLLRYSR